MKIKFEVELDTDNKRDKEIIEELLDRLQELKEMVEYGQQN